MVHVPVGYQAHFNDVTWGCSRKMPLFPLVCAGQTGPIAVHRDHLQPQSLITDTCLPWVIMNNTFSSCSIKLDSHVLTRILFASSVLSLHFSILCFLKPGDADGKVCQHEAPVVIQPLPGLSTGNAFAYENGKEQNMRDTLASSPKSSRDACSKTKLSVYWRGPTNHNFLYLWLSSCACPTGKGKKILSSCCSKGSWAPRWWGQAQSTQSWELHYREKSFPCRQLVWVMHHRYISIHAPHVSQKKLSKICPDVLLYTICVDMLYLHIYL